MCMTWNLSQSHRDFVLLLADPSSKRQDERLILRRLFQYSRADWKIVLTGTLLLLVAALCECDQTNLRDVDCAFCS